MAARKRQFVLDGQRVVAGETRDVKLAMSEMYTGEPLHLPMRIMRAKRSGPVVLLTAAVHGDEVNGCGIIRQLVYGEPLQLRRGTLVCVPVVNIFGFESHDRYMPDRRDLNRSFPGSPGGSLASRYAHRLMEQIVSRCDACIDLHSAAEMRTNFPNIRGDFSNQTVREMAEVFGCELMVRGKGPEGSLRRAATDAGCPTIILEAGEVGKIEPSVLEIGVRGVRNVLRHLGMLDGEIVRPAFQVRVTRTTWLRAELGGLLRFHVGPGDLVQAGQPVATNESVFGEARSILISPVDGIILGMITHPAVKPGEPVCHVAQAGRRLGAIRRAIAAISDGSPEARVRDDLATSIAVLPVLNDRERRRRI